MQLGVMFVIHTWLDPATLPPERSNVEKMQYSSNDVKPAMSYGSRLNHSSISWIRFIIAALMVSHEHHANLGL
ncbi:uncharacterized protein ATNIH1004_009541 [Aspergillus tanneri]|uniref:Uncharacterized protein n=1 Tax=Aspergillus tanneri TaxID=1220188 RepID=A0A5M9ME51_9EURO|nr:uncharacterized protein ATNIH1004_009541 [Aspergillus tanneri]KAA8642789.1 hypothetical protein ATNIH1004_009541 [Aspergillus tanneri]